MKRQGQIQNMESIAVVIIIAILIILGIVFATSQKIGSAGTEIARVQELNSLTIAFKVAGLREIKCSTNSESGNTCFDLYRLKALGKTIDDNTLDADKYYYDIFKKSKISIRPIYPEITIDPDDESVKTIVVYEYKLPEGQTETSIKPSFFPILLYDPLEDKNIFAMLEILVFR